MAEEPKKPQSWWQTVPGILTATAGTITAVTGLVVALNQAGFLTDGNTESPRTVHEPKSESSLPSSPATQSDQPTTGSMPSLVTSGEEQESNDHVSKANWIELGKTYKGTLRRERDPVDYFAFTTIGADIVYVRVLVRVLEWGGDFGNFGVTATLLNYDTEEELGEETAIYGKNLSHAFEILPDRKYFLRLSLYHPILSHHCTYELRLTPEGG